MNPKGFRFRGIPAVESQIVLNKNQVGFTLISCHLRTTPVIFGFDEVNHFLDMYKQKEKLQSVYTAKLKRNWTNLINSPQRSVSTVQAVHIVLSPPLAVSCSHKPLAG